VDIRLIEINRLLFADFFRRPFLCLTAGFSLVNLNWLLFDNILSFPCSVLATESSFAHFCPFPIDYRCSLVFHNYPDDSRSAF
jgi:hypothetical protein